MGVSEFQISKKEVVKREQVDPEYQRCCELSEWHTAGWLALSKCSLLPSQFGLVGSSLLGDLELGLLASPVHSA